MKWVGIIIMTIGWTILFSIIPIPLFSWNFLFVVLSVSLVVFGNQVREQGDKDALP